MNVHKTSEKILIWMKRESFTQEHLASNIGITRQTFITRMKDNSFKTSEIVKLYELGFDK